MQNIRYIIVDDEPLAHEGLRLLMENYPELICINQFYDAYSAQSYLDENSIDLIFLDLEMPGLCGLDFINTIDENQNIMIVTSHRELAYEGFYPNVVAFVLKPIRPELFHIAIQDLKKKIKFQTEFNNIKAELQLIKEKTRIDYIISKYKDELPQKIYYFEIIKIENDQNYIKLICNYKI